MNFGLRTQILKFSGPTELIFLQVRVSTLSNKGGLLGQQMIESSPNVMSRGFVII